jgi:RNA polymerase sigma-70 factor (ECF subfamily)
VVEGLRARRPEVLEELLSAYGRQIHGVAYLVLHSTADAEEVVMDTLLTAWDKAGSLRDPEALKPWLLRIATRHSLSRVRRLRQVDPLGAIDLGIADPSTSAADHLSLVAAVQELPPRMRAAIGLHYYADLDVDAVAEALGRSRNTVKTELRLGLARLRGVLDHEMASPTAVEQTDAT